jgi:hypothetical protein
MASKSHLGKGVTLSSAPKEHSEEFLKYKEKSYVT